MWGQFDFDHINSIEFCVALEEDNESEQALVPCDVSVQDALRDMLRSTARYIETADEEDELRDYELSEKYSSRERLVAEINADIMEVPKSIFDAEGLISRPDALNEPEHVAYYFAVFRDASGHKIVGVRRAAQFKGVLKARLIRVLNDSLRLIEDNVFKLDNEFDLLITQQHVYIMHPAALDQIADIEEQVFAAAHEKTLELGSAIRFADFRGIADVAASKKRVARLVANLHARDDLEQLKKSKVIAAAKENKLKLEKVGTKVRPVAGSEAAFLELLDNRRYTVDIKTGRNTEAFIARSRKRVR
jgi:hypothetical protein